MDHGIPLMVEVDSTCSFFIEYMVSLRIRLGFRNRKLKMGKSKQDKYEDKITYSGSTHYQGYTLAHSRDYLGYRIVVKAVT